jgi:hypothetical protein
MHFLDYDTDDDDSLPPSLMEYDAMKRQALQDDDQARKTCRYHFYASRWRLSATPRQQKP